jgi:hypothetical protein
MSTKAGIRKHGQVAIDALFEEFAQLHNLGVFLTTGHEQTHTNQEKKSVACH